MNGKFTDLIKGRNDGMEILNALGINEATKFSNKAEKTVKTAIELVDQGATIEDAAAQAQGQKTSSALTPPQSNTITAKPEPVVSDQLRDALDGPLIEEGRQAVNGAVPEIAQSAEEAKDEVVGGISDYVKSRVYQGAQEAFESEEWRQAALEAIRGGKR